MQLKYETSRGQMYQATIEQFLNSQVGRRLRGRVQLLITSPPFPLNRKKRYGNLSGNQYLRWFSALAPPLTELLKPDGSIVIELGNAWTPGSPTMSTLALEALLAFRTGADLHLCQQFVSHNPARLPSPVQWVNKERIRVKDAFTHVWWMSKSPRPFADNRAVLTNYSPRMRKLLESGEYNSGKRPSDHRIGGHSFLRDNGGAIPSNVLVAANTSSQDPYLKYCRAENISPHPARMASTIPEFFIRLLSKPKNLVFDPFGGSNTTGATAEELKRRWIATEPHVDYIRGSIGRFNADEIELKVY